MAGMFRLAGLTHLRRMQEEQAAAELARANAEARAAQERRRETAEMLSDATFPHSGDELVWRAAVAARTSLSGLVTESQAAIILAQQRVAAATDEWSEARTRATTLGKLEERHEQATRAEEEHAEQLVLDEAAIRGHRSTTTVPGATPAPEPTTEGDR